MGIEERCWFDVVPILDKQTGVTVRVSNCVQAGDILLHKWPKKPGPSHLAARRALYDALNDWSDRLATEKARTAFEKAAKDAKILGRS